MKFNHFLLPNSNKTSNNPDSELARLVNKGDGEGTLPTNVFPVASSFGEKESVFERFQLVKVNYIHVKW